MTAKDQFAPYHEIREAIERHPVRTAEVPLEHEVSLPVPTMRWGSLAYVVFAMPAHRQSAAPKRLGAPDRWWSIDARSRRLQSYNTVDAIPLTDTAQSELIEIASPVRSLAAHLEDLKALGDLIDAVLLLFAKDEAAADNQDVADLSEVWRAVIPREMDEWYAAAAPDFFRWLNQGVRQ